MTVMHTTDRRQKRIDVLRTSNHIDRWFIATEQIDDVIVARTQITMTGVISSEKSSIDVATEKLRDFAQALIRHADYLDTNRQSEAQEEE